MMPLCPVCHVQTLPFICPFQQDVDLVSSYRHVMEIFIMLSAHLTCFHQREPRVWIGFHFCYLIVCIFRDLRKVEGSTLSMSLELSIFNTSVFYEILL